VGAHPYRLPRPVPLLPGRRVLAEHFLLLGVHADHRLPGRGELLDLAVDVPKLRVAVRVAGALGGPRGALQGEPLGLEQRGHRVRAHRVPLPGQLGGQLPGGLHRPAQRGLRVPTLIRLDQRQQGRDQARIALAQPLAARTHRPHPVGRLTAQLARTARHRRLRHPRNTRHPAHTPIPQHPGSRSQRQAPLPLIQMGQQRGERLPEHHLGLFRHAEILRPNYPIRPVSN
jgi:hypothetical protein